MIMKFNQEYADLLSSGNDICIDNHKVFRPLEAANQIFMKCVVFNADDTLCSLQKDHLKIPKDCHTYLQSW